MARTRHTVDAILASLAVVSRVAAVLVLQSHLVPRSTYEHGEIAANLLAGRGFAMHFLGSDGPTSQQAPVYPAVVAAAYAVFGIESPRALFALEFGQAILGGALVLGVLRLARAIAPESRWLAWIAALVVAIHPTSVYAATHVQVASLGAALLVWTLALAYQAAMTRRLRDAFSTGVLLALLSLTDPILALSSVGVAWVILWTARSGAFDGAGTNRSRRPCTRGVTVAAPASLAVIAVVALAGVGPWLVRNAVVHGEFVPVKSTFGYAFWQGNCALSEGTDKVVRSSVDDILRQSGSSGEWKHFNRTLWAARHEAGYIDDIALTTDDYRALGSLTEPQRSRVLLRRALDELSADPPRYARLCLRRLQYFLLFDETNPKSRVLVYRAAHLGLTLCAAMGLLLAGSQMRRRLMPTIVTAGAITVFHTLTIVSARFHIPIEPLMAVWSAAGLAAVFERASGRDRRPGHSSAAGHDVEGVGVEDRLAVV